MNIKKVKSVTTLNDNNLLFYRFAGLVHPEKNEYSDADVLFLIKLATFRKLGFSINEIEKEILTGSAFLVQKCQMLKRILENERDYKSMKIKQLLSKIIAEDLTVQTLDYAYFLIEMKFYQSFIMLPWEINDYFPEVIYANHFKKLVSIFGVAAFGIILIVVAISGLVEKYLLWSVLAIIGYSFFCVAAYYLLIGLSRRHIKK